jgi:hypothetical protein
MLNPGRAISQRPVANISRELSLGEYLAPPPQKFDD